MIVGHLPGAGRGVQLPSGQVRRPGYLAAAAVRDDDGDDSDEDRTAGRRPLHGARRQGRRGQRGRPGRSRGLRGRGRGATYDSERGLLPPEHHVSEAPRPEEYLTPNEVSSLRRARGPVRAHGRPIRKIRALEVESARHGFYTWQTWQQPDLPSIEDDENPIPPGRAADHLSPLLRNRTVASDLFSQFLTDDMIRKYVFLYHDFI